MTSAASELLGSDGMLNRGKARQRRAGTLLSRLAAKLLSCCLALPWLCTSQQLHRRQLHDGLRRLGVCSVRAPNSRDESRLVVVPGGSGTSRPQPGRPGASLLHDPILRAIGSYSPLLQWGLSLSSPFLHPMWNLGLGMEDCGGEGRGRLPCPPRRGFTHMGTRLRLHPLVKVGR